MKLFCLSGLGVDHRAFQNLRLEGIEMVHIPWIDPKKGESLKDYAGRLFHSIELPEDYNLIGVSFGGMIAQEFAKLQKPKNLYLISTIRKRSELPTDFKIAGSLHLDKIAPMKMMKSGNRMNYRLFGVKTKEDKALLKEILEDTDPEFMRWALRAILTWDNTQHMGGISIHGTKDRILKAKSPDFSIKGAGHFMIVSRAKEIVEKLLNNGLS